MLYKLTQDDINNLLFFLGKLSFSGENNFAEVEAIQRIRLSLSQPIPDDKFQDPHS